MSDFPRYGPEADWQKSTNPGRRGYWQPCPLVECTLALIDGRHGRKTEWTVIDRRADDHPVAEMLGSKLDPLPGAGDPP
jgi:hypothetical protein